MPSNSPAACLVSIVIVGLDNLDLVDGCLNPDLVVDDGGVQVQPGVVTLMG